MRTTILLSGVTSLLLHGFVLSQWPSPIVQIPRWKASEPLDVVYWTSASLAPRVAGLTISVREVAPAPPSARVISPPSILREPERLKRLQSAPATPASPPPPAAHPDPSTARLPVGKGWVPRPESRPGFPKPPDRVAASLAVPSLLTSAEFVQFEYKQRLREQLRRAIAYPSGVGVARGAARLRLTIARDGRIASASCLQADAPAFEQAILQGVASLGALPPLPAQHSNPTQTYEFRIVFTPDGDTTISP